MGLFDKIGNRVVQGSLLEAKWQAEQARQQAALDKLDLFKDDYETIIRATMAKLFHPDNYKRLFYHVNQSQNLLKRVVKEISMVYKAPAKRGLFDAAGKAIDSSRYTEIMGQSGLAQKMKKINQYTNLENELLVYVTVRRGRIVYDILTPNLVMVVQDEDDPTRARAIIYRVDYVDTMGVTEPRYYYWDEEGNHSVLDRDFREKQVVYAAKNYPYRDRQGQLVMPFVVLHRSDPDGTFWDRDTGTDLYNAAVLLGVKMTLFDYYFKVCSFKQIYIKTEDAVPDKLVLDPLTAFVVRGDNAEVGVLDIQANLPALQGALVFQLNTVINNYGISSDAWTLSVSEQSGRALKIRNRALLESREDQLPNYQQAEHDLFDVTRIVNNAHFSEQIEEEAEFGCDFGEIEFPEDPAEELAQKTKELKAGLISLAAFYRHFNPDVEDDQEAEKTIIGNLEKLRGMRDQYPSLDEALDFIMKSADKVQGQAPGGSVWTGGAGA